MNQVSNKILPNLTKCLIWVSNAPEQANKRAKGKMTLRKQTGFFQHFEFRCLGGRYQDLFFQSGFCDCQRLILNPAPVIF